MEKFEAFSSTSNVPSKSDIFNMGVKENKGIVEYIQYVVNQTGWRESKIKGHEQDLKELMGTMDIIKDKVLQMEKMYQCSHC